jgi:hypothetical protein
MADAIASPDGLHVEGEERENLRGNFSRLEDDPIRSW